MYEVQFVLSVFVEAEDEKQAKNVAWIKLHAIEDIEDHCQFLSVVEEAEEEDDYA